MSRLAAVPGRERAERYRWWTLFLTLAITLAVAEIVVRELAERGLVPYRAFPTTREPTFWSDLDPAFGTWHLPSAAFRHTGACFDVTYRSNSYGARDPERRRASTASRRAVVLGDSFVEGYGVELEERLTTRLERATGVEHLNFGVAGHFGPVQEYLLYDTLASAFDHTDVFVFLLPGNDFADMEPANFPPDRYRPYLRPKRDSFEVWYPIAFEDRVRPRPQSWLKIARRRVYNAVYFLNALRRTLEPAVERTELAPAGQCSYQQAGRQEVRRLLFAYERIVERAAGRRVSIFVIPLERDLRWCDPGETAGIIAELEAFARSRPGVVVVDLLPFFIAEARASGRDVADYFLTCDPHWSPAGNRVAAEAVAESAYGHGRRTPSQVTESPSVGTRRSFPAG